MDTADNPTGIGFNAAQAKIAELLEPAGGQPDDGGEEEPELDSGDPESDGDEPEGGEGDDPEAPDDGDDGEESDEDEGSEEPDTYLVKVDGEEKEVTLDELIAGYQKDSDYRQKTQRLAQERQELAQEREHLTAVKQEREQYASLLTDLRKRLETEIEEPDWEALLQGGDQMEYLTTKHRWDRFQADRKASLDAVAEEEKRLKETTDREQKQALERYAREQSDRLLKILPSWKDNKVRATETKAIREWALTQGFTEEDLNGVNRADLIGTLRKAWLYDSGRKKAETARKPARVVKPGEATPRQPANSQNRQRQRLAKTGRVEDAAAAIERML